MREETVQKLAWDARLDIEDEFAIRDLYARYAWALDTSDLAGFTDVFTRTGALIEDREIGAPPLVFDGNVLDFAVDFLDMPESRGRQHFVGNPIVLSWPVPGEHRVRSYVWASDVTDEGPGSRCIWYLGTYTDIVVEEDGRWRFKIRHFQPWRDTLVERLIDGEVTIS